MKNQRACWRLGIMSAITALSIIAAADTGWARNENPGITPPTAKINGLAYGEWSELWWKWCYSFPTVNNPVSDETGTFAALGQSGDVWFLAGSFGQTVTRTINIPIGKRLFFPIINQFWVNVPEYGDNPWSDEQDLFARDYIADILAGANNLSCTIDGYQVKNLEAYRCTTPMGGEYMIDLPPGNLWGIPAGTYGPCVDDGYFLMVSPLKAGQHTIRITANNNLGNPPAPWVLDVTYHITVVAPPEIVSPTAVFEGKTLAEWLSTYWRWNLTGSDMTQSKVGSVQLMPLPAATLISGTGSPEDPGLYRGTVEITLPPDTPFVLPEYAWIGERYNTGAPDDAAYGDQQLFDGVSPYLTIDGTCVMSDANERDFYVPYTTFDPIVTYPAPSSYGSIAAVYFQGNGFICAGLKPGVHVIRLWEPYIIAGFWGVIYDNTWIVTVQK